MRRRGGKCLQAGSDAPRAARRTDASWPVPARLGVEPPDRHRRGSASPDRHVTARGTAGSVSGAVQRCASGSPVVRVGAPACLPACLVLGPRRSTLGAARCAACVACAACAACAAYAAYAACRTCAARQPLSVLHVCARRLACPAMLMITLHLYIRHVNYPSSPNTQARPLYMQPSPFFARSRSRSRALTRSLACPCPCAATLPAAPPSRPPPHPRSAA